MAERDMTALRAEVEALRERYGAYPYQRCRCDHWDLDHFGPCKVCDCRGLVWAGYKPAHLRSLLPPCTWKGIGAKPCGRTDEHEHRLG